MLPGATPAATRSIDAGPFVEVVGPRLAGSEVAWGQRREDQGLKLLAAPIRAGQTHTLASLGLPEDRYEFSAWLAGSDAGVIAHTNYLIPANNKAGDTESTTIDQGSVLFRGGTTTRLTPACRPACDAPVQVDASGSRAVVGGPFAGAVTVVSLTGGAGRTVAAPRASDVRLAGRYLAYQQGADLVVHDLSTDQVAYRLSGIAPNQILSFDVSDNGTVVFGFPAKADRLYSASPAQRSPRPLAVGARRIYRPRISGNQVAWSRRSTRYPGQDELGVASLAGQNTLLVPSIIRPLRFGTYDEGSAETTFDFDGVRLAWAQQTCRGQRVRVASLAALRKRREPAAPLRCPLALREPTYFTRKAILIWYSCAGFQTGCLTARMHARTARTLQVGGKRFPRGTLLAKPAELGGDRNYWAKLVLSRVGKRILRRHPRARITLSAEVCDSTPSSSYCRQQQRTVKIKPWPNKG